MMRDREELERMIDYYVTTAPDDMEQIQEREQDDNEECDFSIPEVVEDEKND